MNESLDRKITTGSLLRFAMPTIISNVFMGLYSTVDGVFVSRLVGTDALSAVNIMIPVILFSNAAGAMLGAGGNAIIARKLGEGKEQEAREDLTFLSLIMVLSSIVLVVLGLIFIRPLIYFLGADEALYPYCYAYAIPSLVIMPLSIFGMMSQLTFISVGKPNLGLITSVMGGVTNMVLDYLLIAVFDMGIAGAAIATGLGFSVPALAGIFYFLFNRKGSLYFVRPKARPWVLLKSCTNGSSEMVTSLSNGIVTILFNNVLMRLAGSDGVAAITIILYAHGILSSAYMGYSFGIAPVISYNYGKQDHGRLQAIYRISLRMIAVFSVCIFIISQLGADLLVGIFAGDNQSVRELALSGFRLFASCFLFIGFNIFSSAMFTALSNGRISAILSTCRNLIFIVIVTLLLPLFIGVTGVWLAIPIAELLGLGMTVYYFRKMKGKYHYA